MTTPSHGAGPRRDLSSSRTVAQVSFITGVPADVRVAGECIPSAEINFLCIHKKLRSKRLAPLLIKEITRRINLTNVWQAVYTAGVVLPKPVATCRYWHRSINPRKLVDVGFTHLSERSTMSRLIKLNKLPQKPQSQGVFGGGCVWPSALVPSVAPGATCLFAGSHLGAATRRFSRDTGLQAFERSRKVTLPRLRNCSMHI
jgi:Myristoyl-CoA:protein N-myristoyltransferase, N-terminal domain